MLGSVNWSWTIQTMEKIKGWETKTMTRLCCLKGHKEEPWVDYHTRMCNMDRKLCINMGLPFLHEKHVASHGMSLCRIECCNQLPQKSLQVVKYVMMAFPKDRNDGTGSRKSHKMEA